MIKPFRLIHNPQCSKSKQAKELLEQNGIEFEIVQYLKTPLTKGELRELSQQLGLGPIDMVRRKEDAFKAFGLDKAGVTDEQVLDAIVSEPRLLERPILIRGKKAVIGRPTEKLQELL